NHCPRKGAFCEGAGCHGPMRTRQRARAKNHGRRLFRHSNKLGNAWIYAAARAYPYTPPPRPFGDPALRFFLMSRVVHIIGAGLPGLAAAVPLPGGQQNIVLQGRAPQAGGRCLSYFNPSLNMTPDNGNHLLLSGNCDARPFLPAMGSEDQLSWPAE